MGRCRVLLIEDDDLLREAIEQVLSFYSYDVVAVSGISKELLNEANSRNFEVILSDFSLAGSDRRALRELRERCPGIPLVIFTGLDFSDLSLENLEAFAIIKKPCETQELIAVIKSASSQKQS